MPRKPIDPSDPDKLQHYVGVHFTTGDLDIIKRMAQSHGISRSAAVRALIRRAAVSPAPREGADA